MLTLYSYPELFGVADNNGYGLKVFAFLKLAGVPFVHEHIFDASAAPRGQLPYIVDDGETIGDSETIIAHLIAKYRLTIDAALTSGAARHQSSGHAHARRSLLGDVVFALEGRALFSGCSATASWRSMRSIDLAGMNKAREYNAQRYHFQGIGRYAPDQAYARGLADLQVLADLIPAQGYLHGAKPTSIDAGIYGFIANIHFLPIPTPLKAFVSDHPNLVRHCEAIHAVVSK